MDRESKLNKIIVEKSSKGDILIQLPFHGLWIEWMKKVPGRQWNPDLRKWIIPRTNVPIPSGC